MVFPRKSFPCPISKYGGSIVPDRMAPACGRSPSRPMCRTTSVSVSSGWLALLIGRTPEEILTEVVLHIERLGDRRFPSEGWIGNRGKKLRIEAFSIRPIDTLVARDIEFKALGPDRRQTPWVTDAKLCGTRGQGLALTGFAVRLVPHVGERFDVVY